MRENHLWNRAQSLSIQTGPDIVGGFDVGFDDRIPEETRDALMDFIYWVEDHFAMPVTLWVDFTYNHYLMDRQGKRVGYRFYWAEFKTFPVFDDFDDLPVIELPVRTERSSIEAILRSFAEAISLYYAWLTNTLTEDYLPEESTVEAVLQAYLRNDI